MHLKIVITQSKVIDFRDLVCRFAVEMKKVGMNMLVKALALPLLAAPLFSSCMVENENPENKFNTSFNEPVANYQVTGKVTDVGAPIAGIRVIADYSNGVPYRADTLYTDKEGRFSKFMSIPRVDKFVMSFTDIDGNANGGYFKSDTIKVKPVRTEMASGRFGGSFIVSAEVVLNKK